MEVWIWIGAAAAIIGSIIVYIGFMIFLPEWVGITGKTAIKNEKSHASGDIAEDDDVLERMQNQDP